MRAMNHNPGNNIAPNQVPSSSPAFGSPIHPIRPFHFKDSPKPLLLPILIPPATLRPLAFRTFTKKHNLTLTSSALQLLAEFIGKHCGAGWREDGLAEKVLDEAAKGWKRTGGGAIVAGEDAGLKRMLDTIERTMVGGHISQLPSLSRQNSNVVLVGRSEMQNPRPEIDKSSRENSFDISSLGVGDDETNMNDEEPRKWLKIVGAFVQPKWIYNANQKRFEKERSGPSFLPDTSHKMRLFRHRYDLIHQRLVRNEAFQATPVSTPSKTSQWFSSKVMINKQAWIVTPIANLLGRSGSSHVLLGMLSISPTGVLTVNDPTGSIALNVQYAKPVPEDCAWFTPGMIVLIDGIYEEGQLAAAFGLDGAQGIGGNLGGEFVAFSFRTPPGESRTVTLGAMSEGKKGFLKQGGGFGWVDFLGLGSERAVGDSMRKMERSVFQKTVDNSAEGRCRMIILGEVRLDNPRTLQALRKVLGSYSVERVELTPMVVVMIGNFVRYAVMAGGGSGGSIEYKEYFDSLASALSDYPTILQRTTFVFIPGDNDPWASAFAAGASNLVPRVGVPELFTSRIKRAFATANADAGKENGKKTDGEAIWTTNPTRLSLFGPCHEIVFFRDDLLGRLRRNAVKFISSDTDEEKAELNNSKTSERTESPVGEVQMEGGDAHSRGSGSVVRTSATSILSGNLTIARKLVKTILDQGHLSPFPVSMRPILWDHAQALQLYPLPTALVLVDPEAPPFALTYGGCHVMNPGPVLATEKHGIGQWIEYNAVTRKGRVREVRF